MLAARGFTQQPGIDYNETFAPVACMDTVRIVLAISMQYKWPVYQMLTIKIATKFGPQSVAKAYYYKS
jgi:hypothetical protein